MHSPTETVLLVDAAQRGDRAALDRLLRPCLPLVYNVAARTLTPADADDVVQETMIRAVAALPRLRQPDRFRSWLIAIAVRETRRRGQRLGAQRQRFILTDTDGLPDGRDPVEEATVERLEAGRQRRALAAATTWLDPDDRELLGLWWLVQTGAMDRQELVQTLGLSPAHARVRLQRLRARLETARLIVGAVEAAPAAGGCRDLRHLLHAWDGKPSSVWRKRLARHVADCRRCGAAGPELLAPERLLAALPLLVPPADLLGSTALHPVASATAATAASTAGASAALRHGIRALFTKPAMAVVTAAAVATGAGAVFLAQPPGRQAGPASAPVSSPDVGAAPSSAPAASPVPSASSGPAGPTAGAGSGGPTWAEPQLPPTQGGRYLYVSGTGSDAADGLSRTTAVRTLRRAAQLTRPGDTVLVGDGEYSEPRQSSVLPIERSGTAQQWITWAAYPGARPVVRATSWQGIRVHASYITVTGFTVIGSRQRLSPAQIAAAQRGDVTDPQVSSNCIAVDEQRTADPPRRPRHVVVWGNTVTDCPLSGISVMFADHVTVAYNVAARNGHHSPYGGSGISLHSGWNSDRETGYKMIVRGNVTYENMNLVPCLCSGTARTITDGNGIIVESFDNADIREGPMAQDPYTGRTLVENNISYNNGGRGVNVFRAAHVDVVNNTLYRNVATPTIEADLAVHRASDVRVTNNIVVARPGRPAVGTSATSQLLFQHNLTVGGSNAPADAERVTGDPAFIDPGSGNFRLRPDSPAVDRGGSLLAPPLDASRGPRNGRCDLGALEAR